MNHRHGGLMSVNVTVDEVAKTISVQTSQNLNLSEVVDLLSNIQRSAEKFKYNNQKFSFQNEIDSDAFEDLKAYQALSHGLNRILSEYHGIN